MAHGLIGQFTKKNRDKSKENKVWNRIATMNARTMYVCNGWVILQIYNQIQPLMISHLIIKWASPTTMIIIQSVHMISVDTDKWTGMVNCGFL